MMSMQTHKDGGLVTGTLDGLLSAERETTQLQAGWAWEQVVDAKVENLLVDKILRAA